MAKGKFYITTAIDYTNGIPHIGHAYEKITTDVIARWHRLLGHDVFFLTGTDENAQKVEKAARERGMEPKGFVDQISEKFKELCKVLNISIDGFIRTTDPRHVTVASKLFKKVFDKGDIYKGHYEGYYCNGCASFYKEKDLDDKKCPTHKTVCDYLKEESYFFKMGKYKPQLMEYIESNPDFIKPDFRRNEVLNRLKEELKDLCVSRRNINWGIPLPNDPEHAIYVWFDALINYISGISETEEMFEKYWPADVHVIGKDISWFHCVIWPCILLAVDYELPRTVFVHGFWNIDAAKMSKTAGNVIDPNKVAEEYGVDTLRYFMLREIPYGHDGDFTFSGLIDRNNSDLGNSLGNLLHRTLSMVEKYLDGAIEKVSISEDIDKEVISKCENVFGLVSEVMRDFQFNQALDCIWDVVRSSNKYIEQAKPWELKKSNDLERLKGVLYNLCESLRIISLLLSPFLPQTSEEMRRQLGISREDGEIEELVKWGRLESGTIVKKGDPLFPRIEE